MDADAMRDFAAEWLEATAGEAIQADKRRHEVEELVQLFEAATGNNGTTLWDGYNAVTESLDHEHARYRGPSDRIKAAGKLESTLSGQSYARKGKAREMPARW